MPRRSSLVLLVALASSSCSDTAYPRRSPALLELVAADDPRAVDGEPLVARIAPGLLMEDVAHQMFARAAQLGYGYLSSLETHAQVSYGDQVFDCAVAVGSRTEVDAWEASHAGTPAVERGLARRVRVGEGTSCVSRGNYAAETDANHHVVLNQQVEGGSTHTTFVERYCGGDGRGHDMYLFQQMTALGDPVWAWIGLGWPSGFAESKPRCTELTSAHVGDPPVHTLTAIVYKR